MRLLDTASLIVTPNGYKEGKLYSVIPSDGSGDLSVVRATTATRVNSAGLVELVPYNLFTYSSSFSNAAWAKVNSTVTGGQNGYDGTTNAFLITDNSTSGVHLIGQTPVVSGQHTISIYAKANSLNWIWLRGVQSSANVRAWFNLSTGTIGTVETNGTANIESVGNGWYRCSLTIANHQSGFEFYYGVANANATIKYVGSGQSIFVQDAQLVEGSTAKDYQKTETRLNIPRLDYSNGTCPSLLVEPQRTNIALQSSSFDTSPWILGNNVGAATITANNAIAPDGTLTADKIAFPSVGSPSQWSLVFQPFTASASAYNGSFYIKGELGTEVVWISFTKDGVNYQRQICNLTTEWQRFDISATLTSGADNFQIGVDTRDSSQTARPAQTIYLWGAQLEAGSYATSYIPTTSASVTRNADVISKTGISSLIGQTEGTLFVDVNLDETSDYNGWFLKDNASYDTFVFLQRESNGTIAVGYYGSGALQARIETAPSQPSGHYKIAFGYKNNDFVMYVNGTQIGTDTSGSVSGLMDYFDIHFGSTGANHQHAAALWKTRLTNTQLAQLTSI